MGPDPGPTLRDRAVSAGLAALPSEPIRPVDNPYHAPRVELGRLLFFDPILSGPRDVACSTCHLPRLAFGDGRQFPVGAGGSGLGPQRTRPDPASGLREMERNSPPVLNTGLFGRMTPAPHVNGTMFWSGSAFGLEDQVLNPISNDKELRGTTYSKVVARDSVLTRLRAIPGYVERFAAGFPEAAAAHGNDPLRLVTAGTLRRALAAYLRELVTPDAPLDRFLRGDDGALTPVQADGLELFVGKADCVACHTGPLLSDFTLHVLGTEQEGLGRDSTPGDDLGWGEHGGTPYSFRTPPLRQVALTAPYFHAGTAQTLEEVLRFKNAGRSAYHRVPDAALDPKVAPLGLSEGEIADLVAFLGALTDTRTMAAPLFQPPETVPSGLEVPR
jgi:cytochrome c peroxidase